MKQCSNHSLKQGRNNIKPLKTNQGFFFLFAATSDEFEAHKFKEQEYTLPRSTVSSVRESINYIRKKQKAVRRNYRYFQKIWTEIKAAS